MMNDVHKLFCQVDMPAAAFLPLVTMEPQRRGGCRSADARQTGSFLLISSTDELVSRDTDGSQVQLCVSRCLLSGFPHYLYRQGNLLGAVIVFLLPLRPVRLRLRGTVDFSGFVEQSLSRPQMLIPMRFTRFNNRDAVHPSKPSVDLVIEVRELFSESPESAFRLEFPLPQTDGNVFNKKGFDLFVRRLGEPNGSNVL